MSGSGVSCRAQDGGLQQLLDCIQTVRILRCIGNFDLAAFDRKSFRFSGGIADFIINNPPVILRNVSIRTKRIVVAHDTLPLKARKRQPPIEGSWRSTAYRHDCGWQNGTIVPVSERSGLRQQTGFF